MFRFGQNWTKILFCHSRFATLKPMKRIIFSVLTLTLLSQKSLADSQIIAESVLQINKSHVDQGIQSTLNAWQSKPLTLKWARIDLPTEFPSWLENVQLQIQFNSAEAQTKTTGSAWDFKSSAYSIQLTAEKLTAKGQVVQRRGSVRIVVPIDASCSKLQSTYKETSQPLTVKTVLKKDNPAQVYLDIEQILFSFVKQNVSTQMASCSGPAGMKEFIDEKIKSAMADQNLWMSRVKQTIESQLSFNFKLEQVLWKNPSLATQVSWLGDSWSETTQSYRMKGKASVYIGQTGKLNSVTELSLDPHLATSEATTLFVPKTLVSEMLAALQSEGLLSLNFLADDFRAFRDLQRNWFTLLFIWPDLLRYSTETDMSWLVQPLSAPQTSIVSTSGSPVLRMNTNVRADLFAGENNRMIPYMNFRTPLNTEFQLQAHDGQVDMTVLKMDGLNISAQWDNEFLKTHSPNTHFAKQTISGQIRKKLLNNKFSFSMETLSPLPWLKMNLQNLTTSGDNLNLEFNLIKDN